MKGLLTCLEALTGPDREVDALLHGILHGGTWNQYWPELPEYTDSIDAALTLVPEGKFASVSSDGEAFIFDGRDEHGDWFGQTDSVIAATPAIALSSAALKARGVE